MNKKIVSSFLTSAIICILATSFAVPASAEKIYYKRDVDETFYEALLKITDGYSGNKYMNQVTSEDETVVKIPFSEEVTFYNESNKGVSFSYSVDSISENIRNDDKFDLVITYEFYVSDEVRYDYSFSVFDRNLYSINELKTKSGIPKDETIKAIRIKEYIIIDDKFSKDSSEDYESYWDAVSAKYITDVKYIECESSSWIKWNNELYYVKQDGTIATASCLIDGIRYKFNSNGVCKGRYTGWVKNSQGERFYYKNGMKLSNCWLKVNGKRTYYLQKNGKMAVGKIVIGNKTYVFDSNGKLRN